MGQRTTLEVRTAGEPTIYLSIRHSFAYEVRGVVVGAAQHWVDANVQKDRARFVGDVILMLAVEAKGDYLCWSIATNAESVPTGDDAVVLSFDGDDLTVWSVEHGEIVDRAPMQWRAA